MYELDVILPDTGESKRILLQMTPEQAKLYNTVINHFQSGYPNAEVKWERLLTSHMELEATKAVLMAQDLSGVQTIILTHLFDRNSDEERFVDDTKALTRKPVYAAKAGMTICLTKNPH